MSDLPERPLANPRLRIEAVDVARGVALMAMAVYHFTWDLEFFGYIASGTTAFGAWKMFARCIASSFLFLVGVSLVLGHADGIRWHGFARRLAIVAGAAAAISLITWYAVPDAFIFFGILHQIALASVLGLIFLRVPWPLTLVAAVLVIAAPHFARAAVFDHPAWWWLGLSPVNPRSNDYVPLFPWFGAVLLGMAATRIAHRSGITARLAALRAKQPLSILGTIGRHSLLFYLVHQPILIGFVWIAAQLAPPVPESRESQFTHSCSRSCQETRDATFCLRYCDCMLEALKSDDALDMLFAGEPDPAFKSSVEDLAAICTANTDDAMGPSP